MDPYLEHPALWQGVHNRLIADLDDELAPRLRPRYFIAVEERVYVAELPDMVGRPDAVVVAPRHPAHSGNGQASEGSQPTNKPGPHVLVAALPVVDRIRELYLEVRETATGDVVTSIEVLSPTNKLPGRGRRDYEEKRLETLGTRTSLVEIDLLRGGEPMPARLRDWPAGTRPPGDYRVVVARGWQRPWADVYAFTVRDSIPSFPIPLKRGDEEIEVPLQRLVHAVYDRGSYDLRLDYGAEAVPPLTGDDAAWADALLRSRGLRT
jgi:hypothetical protein